MRLSREDYLRLSALADGELDDEEHEAALSLLAKKKGWVIQLGNLKQ